MNQLYVGIDVSSAKNAVYLMMPDGSKHSSFSVQNNLSLAPPRLFWTEASTAVFPCRTISAVLNC